MTPEKAFGKVLREIRQGHSLSQEDLGFESGYHRTYISLLERGKGELTVECSFLYNNNRQSPDLANNRFLHCGGNSITT